MTHGEATRSHSQHEELASRGILAPGAAAGDYVISELVARGGCGSVYRARHASLARDAAVKVLHASLAGQPKMVERFVREVRVVDLLKHPNIIEIYDIGCLPDGRPYYAMEYLPGRTLTKLLLEQGRVPPDEVLELLGPVCAALEAAHAAGVIHRDVKASNIMVDAGDPPGVKLLDFGIAKLLGAQAGAAGLTTDGRQLGTLTIMAPEQILGGLVDARTDVYALGVLLFRMLTGRLPFEEKSPLALAQQHLEEPAPRPSQAISLPPALDAIVLRCLEKRPERRYPSVGELLTALRRATPSAGRRSNAAFYAPANGVAVYLDIQTSVEADDLDEALSDDVGVILDLGEETLAANGFIVASATGSQVLGVRPLPPSAAAALADREAAIELAGYLRRQIDGRRGADRRIHVNLCIHAGEVLLRTEDPPDVLGGALMRVDQWAPRGAVPGLCGTPEAVEGLSELALTVGPGALVGIGGPLVARRAGG
jgi:serine/threonine-protein kinase